MSEFDLYPIPTDPEVVVLDGTEDEGAEREDSQFDAISFGFAEVGDVMFIPDGHPIPDEWVALDGSRMLSRQWPEFVRAMKLTDPSFQLPVPKGPPGELPVIKLGRKREDPSVH